MKKDLKLYWNPEGSPAQDIEIICPNCGGSGKDDGEKCKTCNGRGKLPK